MEEAKVEEDTVSSTALPEEEDTVSSIALTELEEGEEHCCEEEEGEATHFPLLPGVLQHLEDKRKCFLKGFLQPWNEPLLEDHCSEKEEEEKHCCEEEEEEEQEEEQEWDWSGLDGLEQEEDSGGHHDSMWRTWAINRGELDDLD